jgi:hypothetical protein
MTNPNLRYPDALTEALEIVLPAKPLEFQIGGQRFSLKQRWLYFRECTGPSTLDVALSLRERVEVDFGPLPFVLLLNKSDLKEQWVIGNDDVARLRENGWWVQPSSARTGEGVEDAFQDLAVRTAG